MPPAQTLTHAADCSRPQPSERRDQRGSLIVTCPECRRYALPTWRPPRAAGSRATPPATERAAHADEPTPMPTPSRYLCRVHELPVSAAGRGCPRCMAALADRTARRRASRASQRGSQAKRAKR